MCTNKLAVWNRAFMIAFILPSGSLVVVCHSGNRSAKGRDILLNAGFTQVTSMAGGLIQWQAAGYPTVSGP